MSSHKDSEARFIDVADLRIGLYVYLDLGWMQHPFALNNFKITSRDQIDTILKLGLNRVRWSPEKSDPEPGAAATTAQPTTAVAAPEKVSAGGTATASADTPNPAVAIAVEDGDCAASEAVSSEAETRQQRRERLSSQRESLEVCERQFATAARSYRLVVEEVRNRPEAARQQAEQAIGAMVGKMLEQEESAIRLLSENAGEKASMHCLNVTVISLLMGRAMGLDAATLNELGIGCLLHDIGKIELPERLRWSDTQFSQAERKIYHEHVARGVALAQAMKLSPGALAVIAQHHELADGRGYPRQLTGDKITPLARIVALVNHYDTLCNPANPALAVTPHEALSQIFAQMKRQFDPQALTQFIRMMGVYPPGSVVELSDGRFALVVSVNSARPLKPHVVVFDARVPREEALVEDLEHTPDLGIRRSLKPLQLPKAAFDYLSPRQRMCYFFERARSAHEDGEDA
ncbi:MAG: HD domain-containing phosphohydrolase [Pseudomonadota bacterium]